MYAIRSYYVPAALFGGATAGVRALFPRRPLVVGVYLLLVLGTFGLFRAVPAGFLPDEDQGYFITSFQLPDGASIQRTDAVAREVERILLGTQVV